MQETDSITTVDRQVTSTPTSLERAIVATVAYSDIFDYPLTAADVHRYLIGMTAARADIDAALAQRCLLSSHLATHDGCVTLAGRESIAGTRRARERDSARLWPEALRYGRIIASLPYVRMVAITGELAMDNVQSGSDIDYFVVTQTGRLWLCRLLVIGVVRYARLRDVTVCPNYLLAESALVIHERNLYSAHELAQLVPIAGHAVYERLRAQNDWVTNTLPNAVGSPRELAVQPRAVALRRLSERLLGGRIGARIERWEMDRKIRKLSQTARNIPEASYAPSWCKGHVSGHESRVLAAFDDRRHGLEEGVT